MDQTDQERPETSGRRWLRFSLKTVFVLVSLYCIWLAIFTLQARRQQQAVARVQQLGGRLAFTFELEADGRDWRANPQPFVPDWIRRAVGEDHFRRLAIINFDEGSDPSDDDLLVLNDLPDLQQLTFSNRRKVTDTGLAHLVGLSQLKVLVLDGTSVTGPGLRRLRSLRQLEFLTLSSTPVTDEGLEHLRDMSSLTSLQLNDTKISDKGLRHVAAVLSLEELQLVNTAVTDAGLKHLETLHRLKRILLRGTKTTPQGRATLQEALPNCKVPP